MKTNGSRLRPIITCLLITILVSPSYSTLFLHAGDVYEWDFSLAPGGSPNAWISFGYDLIHNEDQVRASYFEDSISESPVWRYTFKGESFSYGTGSYSVNFASYGFFQDMDGVFLLEVLRGSVGLESLGIATNIGGINYYSQVRPTFIPEYASGPKILSAVALFFVLMKRQKRIIQVSYNL